MHLEAELVRIGSFQDTVYFSVSEGDTVHFTNVVF